ncbi:hypothetical protein R3W88_029269 [Solanum pinnatisectum]|uniref:Reverse transcriptase zinc-binding domain-containing protein n=1 Tax=Solanum pinnatisectum TaxID=50273 RepID=A0AAV9K4T7_9SOLN|nr:hypothetical protein R3W88_029269 [Solanum pinnatisectum]
MWLLYHHRLPTNQSLKEKGISVNLKCQYCDYPKEDSSHIFFECQNSLNFWNSIQSKSDNQGATIAGKINESNWIDEWHSLKNKNFNH